MHLLMVRRIAFLVAFFAVAFSWVGRRAAQADEMTLTPAPVVSRSVRPDTGAPVFHVPPSPAPR